MPTINLLKRAELEVQDACDWYEQRQKGLSKYFRNELRTTLNFVAANPNIYSMRYNTELYFAPLNKFPFVLIYWFDKDLATVVVVSVFNTKRNPDEFISIL